MTGGIADEGRPVPRWRMPGGTMAAEMGQEDTIAMRWPEDEP
jgi:hypothetical protein